MFINFFLRYREIIWKNQFWGKSLERKGTWIQNLLPHPCNVRQEITWFDGILIQDSATAFIKLSQ